MIRVTECFFAIGHCWRRSLKLPRAARLGQDGLLLSRPPRTVLTMQYSTESLHASYANQKAFLSSVLFKFHISAAPFSFGSSISFTVPLRCLSVTVLILVQHPSVQSVVSLECHPAI